MFGLIRALLVMFIASVLVGACLIGCEHAEFIHHIYIIEVDGDEVPGSGSSMPSEPTSDDDMPSSADNASITNEDLDVDQ